MGNPERPDAINLKQVGFISMASLFNGVNYPLNRAGYADALAAMREQKRKIMPPVVSVEQITRLVVQKDPIIKMSEQMAASALEAEDFGATLLAANHLHAFGEADFKDSLGGEAFALSLHTHRAIFAKVVDRFASTDVFLRGAWSRINADLQKPEFRDNPGKEYKLIRGTIHMVALNGTLGEEAKQQFDPFSVSIYE